MNRFDQRKITKNLVAIRKVIQTDIDHFTDRLVKEGVFTKDVRAEINSVRPKVHQLQCGVLISKLLRSGPEAYAKFIKILEEKGYQSLIDKMENSVHKGTSENSSWASDKEKTFIIPHPMVPKNFTKSETIEEFGEGRSDSRVNGTYVQRLDDGRHDDQLDDVQRLERMMTFVLNNLGGDKDNNCNRKDFKQDLHQVLKDESNGNEELTGFFQSLRYNSLSLTS